MPKISSRLARIPRFGRRVIALVIGSVALVTAGAYWQTRLGYTGVGVVGGLVAAGLVAVIALPDRAWNRIAGIDTLQEDLGHLHAVGALLRDELPWVPDATPEGLDEWEERLREWDDRVQKRLLGSHWVGTYLSPLGRVGAVFQGYARASRYRDVLDERLERLAQIIRGIGGR